MDKSRGEITRQIGRQLFRWEGEPDESLHACLAKPAESSNDESRIIAGTYSRVVS